MGALSANTLSATQQEEVTVSQQAKRYLCLVGIFTAGGWLVWLGDEWRISTVPAHYLGYLVAAIGVAGLLGINIWVGGPLDKRIDANAAGNVKSNPPKGRL